MFMLTKIIFASVLLSYFCHYFRIGPRKEVGEYISLNQWCCQGKKGSPSNQTVDLLTMLTEVSKTLKYKFLNCKVFHLLFNSFNVN